MAFADSSQTQVAFVEESTFLAGTPATPTWQKVRVTGESLNKNIENTTSNEIRPDADVSDLIQTGSNVGGDLNLELTFGASDTDTLFEHALRGSFATNVLKGGVEKKSLSIEKLFETGTTDQYHRFAGCVANTMSLNVQAQSVLTGSVGFMGLSGTTGTAALSGATYNAANTNDVQTAIDVASISVGGATSSIYYTDMSISLTNNCRYQQAVGSLPAVGIGYGRREITGTLNAYFEDGDLYEEFVAGNASSLTFATTDGTNTYTFTLPKIKYSSGSVTAGGNNQDVMVSLQFQALYDSTAGCAIKIENA